MKRKELEDKRREDEKKSREEREREMEAEKKKMEEEGKRLETEEEAKRKAEVNMKEVTHISQVKSDFQEVKDNSVPGLTLTKELEARRLQWVKEHTPWRKISTAEERNHPVAMKSKPSRRIFSASKRLPALTEEQLLKSSPPDTPLFRVKCIVLRDAQSCNMESLCNCPELQSLTLHNCGLLAVEGLEKCTEMQELYLEKNQIEAINCKGLSKLEEASFANNNLTSIHGLEGCHNVVTLDLSNNKITRIGDLSSCSKIQRLFMDNNQLINTKGLSCLTNLQHLSLAHNHLARVYDIDKAMLLQTLNLQANNLQEPPQLTNCVLLRELELNDNSISSLDSLSRAWLPLLRCLSVSQNSISQLSPLGNLIMLDSLDISNNLISDTDSLIPGLQGCKRLKTLKIEGNPVHEDPDCRALVLEQLSCLRWLDGENLSGKGQILETIQCSFVGLCLNQFQSQEDLESRHKKETSFEDNHATDPLLVSKRLALKRQHNRERLELAVRHLLEHENFNPDHFPPLVKEKILEREESKEVTQNREAPKVMDKEDKAGDKLSGDPQKRRNVAATKIQALWRGWYIRHLIDVNTTKLLAAVSIQSAWRGHLVRSQLKREAKESWDPKRNSAATVIQAHFRGRRVRRRLAEALKAAQFYDGEEEEDFDYDEEVDLTAFEFDETVLEQGWTPSETPQLPSRGPVLRIPTQSSKIPTTRFHEDLLNKTAVPKPRHAWRSADSPITDVNQIDVARTITDHDQMSETSGAQSHLSHRAEELSSEWGFQSSGTAEMMLKRAKKMKYNPARKKKLLDPNKRLALFKKLDETNKLRDVKPPPARRQPPNRIDYFAARQAMANHLTSTSPASEQQNREQMTYSWVYRQAVVHKDEEKNIMADQKEFAPDKKTKQASPQKTNRSPVNLPHMDPVVLSGRTLPLISSPLFSHSVEQASSEEPSPRRKSLSSEGHVRFPAIKTHSVPNLLARSTASGDQPIRTEKSNSAGARINRDSRTKR
ncbi:unnamed protein product [Porites evermanni]|uniref:Leucine-rich repeat and IQ domain-containing protein 1 n=1 Tax=Porites evermanni TaxID=104178 RepID=A0ABN8M6B8_9CNID|nr:unnamed protein product [Porites evermanni]